MEIKQKIKDKLKEIIPEQKIIDIVVKNSKDSELIKKYRECQDLLNDKDLTEEEKENLKRQMDLLDGSLKKHGKEHIKNFSQ